MSQFVSGTSIELLEGPTFQYIPFIDQSAFQKVEVVQNCTLVDGIRQREMVWHRYSYADAVSGPFDIMFDVPFGLAAVSGDAL